MGFDLDNIIFHHERQPTSLLSIADYLPLIANSEIILKDGNIL